MTVENTVAAGYAGHSGALRNSTQVYLQSVIHKVHLDSEITVVAKYTCNLENFAAESKVAASSLDDTEGYFQKERTFNRPHRRVGAEGHFSTSHELAKFNYTYDGADLVVYEATCLEDQCEREYYFVVHAKSRNLSGLVDRLIKEATEHTARVRKEIWVFDEGMWRKDEELYQSMKTASWDDVILPPEIKESFYRDTTGFFTSEPLYKRFNIPWKRGIIAHGPPGNGKTISIKALMRTLSELPTPVPSLYVKSFHSRAGSRYSISQIFSMARRNAPCLLILEDLDSLIKKEIRSYFLNEVDGLAGNEGMLIVGTTNHLELLDPAIAKRPSRFDRKIPFTDPKEEARRMYAGFWRRKLGETGDIDISEEDCGRIAALTEGFSFAYMQEAFVATLRSGMFEAGDVDDLSGIDSKRFMEWFEQNSATLREHMATEEEEEDEDKKKKGKKGKKSKKNKNKGKGKDKKDDDGSEDKDEDEYDSDEYNPCCPSDPDEERDN